MDTLIHQMVDIDAMQFSFTPGRGTTDAIFIVRQLQEKFIAAKKPLYLAFVDLEKAFDRVPRRVLWWAMRSLGVEEWAVRVVQAMYSNARSRVRVNGQYSEEFDVSVGVHQGSVLSPLLFIIVLEALSREFRTGVPWELLYADDLVIIADSLEECIARLRMWKSGMEEKGLRVNMKKTKVMISGTGLNMLKDSGLYPCAVCPSGVGERNAIQCSRCKLWVHGRKKCSGINGSVSSVDAATYVCLRCSGDARPIDGRPVTQVDVDGTLLDVEPSFCYLGDMLDAGGGCKLAVTTRCRTAWGKFKRLLPILTSRHVSLITRGKLFTACVRSALLHASETWGPTHEDLERLRRNERCMVRWICGVKPENKVSSATLCAKLGIEDIESALRTRRLRWYGHVSRASTCINTIRDMPIPGRKRRGGQHKTWAACVKSDIVKCNLSSVDTRDRVAWRAGVRRSRLLPTPVSGNPAAEEN